MEFDINKYKVYTWKNWMMLHWIINPGLAINELIFGQRVPRISLEDKTSDKPRIERSYVPCPHCNTIHDSRTWSTQNGTAFKNWFGLYCTNCGQIIPCLTNAFSFLLLALTFPIWGWFRKSMKERWLKKQPERFKNLNLEGMPNPFEGQGWIKAGLNWGLFMFFFMTFLVPFVFGDPITWKKILIAIPIWTIGGLGFGYFVKLFANKKGTPAHEG